MTTDRMIPRHDADVLQTTDAQVWAEDFVKRFTGWSVSNVYSHGAVDVALMVGWFANAIERGREAGLAASTIVPHDYAALTRVSGALVAAQSALVAANARNSHAEYELRKAQRDQMEMAERAASEIEALRQQAASLRPAAEAWSVMSRLIDALVRQPSQGLSEDVAWMLRQKAMKLKDELQAAHMAKSELGDRLGVGMYDAAGDKPSDS